MTGAEIARPPIHRIPLAQLAILVPVGLGLVISGKAVFVAYSFLCGGLVAILPQAYFAIRAFRWRGARSAQAIARAGYSAEIGKFVLSVAGFALVFALVRPIHGPAVFVGFVLMLVVQISGSWLLIRQSNS
ncbi:MAG: ATP synthase subunit I [Halioglobus sp.]